MKGFHFPFILGFALLFPVSCSSPRSLFGGGNVAYGNSTVAKTEKKVKNAPYKVRGKIYKPMSVRDALRYEETGYASWYGGSKKKVRTSSGEWVNPQTSLTAAHRTLPIPCKVRVTCLTSGKSVIVRVNNRGPFHQSRIIDLTTYAAHHIDLKGRGVGKVHVKVISVGDPPHEVSL